MDVHVSTTRQRGEADGKALEENIAALLNEQEEHRMIFASAPQRSSNVLKEKHYEQTPLKSVHLVEGGTDPEDECRCYADLLTEQPVGMVCLGIVENGHIAIHDPPAADFQDAEVLKVVALDMRCRQQQVNDGCFASPEAVPNHPLILAIPTLLGGKYLYCVVHGPITTDCQASILRTHDHCPLYLDAELAGANVKSELLRK